jgi:16S rRNA (guanine527-N7)-methyltransferase
MASTAENSQLTQTVAQPVDLHLLEEGCRQLGVPLTAAQLTQFALYYHELITWNQKFNLTGITELQEVQTKHFLDSIVSLPLLAEELAETLPPSQARRCIDVGTGAGLPGIPLKLVAPLLHWTLLDGTGKKITFLRHVSEQLGLTGVDIVQGRAEEIGRNNAFRAKFDIVTARAVAPLSTLIEYLLPLVALNGLVMIYKGAGTPQEFIEARKAIQLLGGETVRVAPIQVPFLEEQRFIVLIKKVRPTPNLYPRGQGLARKKPIN